VEDREGEIAMRGEEGRVDSKIKVDVCLDCRVLGLNGSTLICLSSCSNLHMLDRP